MSLEESPNSAENAAETAAERPRLVEGGKGLVVNRVGKSFNKRPVVRSVSLSVRRGEVDRDCGRPCEAHQVELRDRVGANFPVLPDTGCRNTVFNSVAQSAAEYVGRIYEEVKQRPSYLVSWRHGQGLDRPVSAIGVEDGSPQRASSLL